MSERARHLILVGMMGAGKSTVGARCAEALHRPYVDTDEIIEGIAGVSVAEVFARDGEAAFRALERTAVADACASPAPAVIAAGGGAVLDTDNRKRMRESGFVMWLQAPAAQLARRVGNGTGRPLLSDDASGTDTTETDTTGTLERLDALRRPAYEAAAHATVETEGLSVGAVVEAVLAAFAATSERVP